MNEKSLEYSFNGEDNPLTSQWFHTLENMKAVKESICMGYKIWVLAKQYGYEIQFDPYQGEKSGNR